MSSAKLYVSTNVVDRLTRPVGDFNSEPIRVQRSMDDSMLRTFDSQSSQPFGLGQDHTTSISQSIDLSSFHRPAAMDVASFLSHITGA
jgi:hypothetical protein